MPVCCGIAVLVVNACIALTQLHGIRLATAFDLSEFPPHAVVVSPEAAERHVVLPVSGIDGKWWAIHASQMLRTGEMRIRETKLDNAPTGREVHWSNGLTCLLAATASLIGYVEGMEQSDAIGWAAVVLPSMLGAACLLAFAVVFARRFGLGAASLAVLLLGTYLPSMNFFRLGDYDHHGLAGWFSMMGVLCLVAGGGGVAGDRRSAHWFAWGGISSAAALWVSAATALPIIAATAAGGLLAGFSCRRTAWARAPHLWRVWGLAGGAASLGFYLLEYFPAHMGWRLEVNHPLYALAWVAGGDLLRRAHQKLGGGKFAGRKGGDMLLLAASLAAALAPLALVALAPDRFFWVRDKFLLELHNRYIAEFGSYWEATSGPAAVLVRINSLGLPAVVAVALVLSLLFGKRQAHWNSSLLLVLAPAALMFALGVVQVRWLGIAGFLVALLGALVAAPYFREARGRRLLCAAALVLLCLPSALSATLSVSGWLRSLREPEAFPRDFGPSIVARDIAHKLIRSSKRLPVLLSGPTTSTDLAYFGGTPVIGTLYWENRDGLKAAASIFSATSDASAKQAIEARGITHVVLFSWDDFVEEYQSLLRGGATGDVSFFARLTGLEEPPQWLRPLAYPIPAAMGLADEQVYLYEFAPHQSRTDWLVARGLHAMDMGDRTKARGLLRQALAEDPSSEAAQRWLGKLEAAPGPLRQPADAEAN